MNRRKFLPSTVLATATAAASQADAATNPVRRQIKITGISTELLKFPPSKRRRNGDSFNSHFAHNCAVPGDVERLAASL